MLPPTAPSRVVIRELWPTVDDGATPIRRVVGDSVEVYANVFADGSAGVRARVWWQRVGTRGTRRAPMVRVGEDRWRGEFSVEATGEYRYGVEGWVDPFLSWRTLLDRRLAAGSVEPRDIVEGAEILRASARHLRGPRARAMTARAEAMQRSAELEESIDLAHDPSLEAEAAAASASGGLARSAPPLRVTVDPVVAQQSAWYELFPRSTSPLPGRAGTFRDLRARLPHIAELGFDVVYLPPVHPIGDTNRRGPNNTVPAPPGAPGSPWAIGSDAGGHTEVHPELGDLIEFRRTVEEAHRLGLAIALDLAFQCSPDHPWVHEHPSWFHHLPDGSIRPAENPPKRYDDIYPIDFDTGDWPALWTALKAVVDFWIAEGIRWFRVDNPHTKPFAFWSWLIAEVRREHPEVMFLAEAFTRPAVMYELAKVGFTHSYTYFAWRTQKHELEAYFRELASGAVAELFRPHLWPNTPDILTEQFHRGQRSVFLHRLLLAATLSPHYGIYGPPYELREHVPLEPGKEEYLRSEKYEIRHWELDSPTSIAREIRSINRIRREHPALVGTRGPVFHRIDNDALLAYSRRTPDRSDVLLVIVNLDPEKIQSGWTALDLSELGFEGHEPFEARDLLTGEAYRWQGPRNFVRLDPAGWPAHLLALTHLPPPSAGPAGPR